MREIKKDKNKVKIRNKGSPRYRKVNIIKRKYKSQPINLRNDDKIIYFVENKLPKLIKEKPHIKSKLTEVFSDVFAEKKDIFAVLNEIRKQGERFDKKFEKMLEESNKRFAEMREESDRKFAEMREESNRRFNEMMEESNKRFAEMREESDRKFAEMREESNRKFEEINRRFEQVFEEIKLMRQYTQNVISAIGGRWGIQTERTFREGVKEILEKYFGAQVKELYIYDKDGILKGRPEKYQVDILITDSQHIIIEIKSQATEWDVLKLHKLGIIYEKESGVKPRLILLSPFPRDEAWKEAERIKDVQILTSPSNIKT